MMSLLSIICLSQFQWNFFKSYRSNESFTLNTKKDIVELQKIDEFILDFDSFLVPSINPQLRIVKTGAGDHSLTLH